MGTDKKTRVTKYAAIAAPPVIAILLFAVFSRSRALANRAVRGFSRPAKDVLGTVFGLLPFSVMELMYIAAGVGLIAFLALSVRAVVRAERKLPVIIRRVGALALAAAYILGAYLWLLGIDYHADSFSEKSGLSAGPVKTEDLLAVTEHFVKTAARLAPTVERDADGHYIEDLDAVLPRSATVYDALSDEFPCLLCRTRVPKKMLAFSKISSAMGFTGVFFPFTGESNINIDAPAAMIPCTVAHELAHQRSVYSEQEANFLGVAACVSSGDAVYRYSGYLSGSVYLMNALYRADRDAWRELSKEITGPMLTDWLDDSDYWRRFEGPVSDASEKLYDGFLKAQGQELGIASYGACVDLLVAYYADKI